MANDTNDSGVQQERSLLMQAKAKGRAATLGAYIKLSGPGWLQSAITLGGGSLASSLYLGVLVGTSFLWLQPLAMILGVIMLSAISYVTLSTGERPLRAINKHVNPVLGWGWILATLMANLVWSLPQFSLATAGIRQNLLRGVFGDEGGMDPTTAKQIICFGVAAICVAVVWFHGSGRRGFKLFDVLLKLMVGVIVVCFVGVIVRRSMSPEGMAWGQILSGLVPDFSLFSAPAKDLVPFIEASSVSAFWTKHVVKQQREVVIAAAATAVGINMTFLLPYSMLRRGWDKHFRGLAIFDLATGLFIPFILVTGCVVIVSATQFHTETVPGLLGEVDDDGKPIEAPANLVGRYEKLAGKCAEYGLAREIGEEDMAKLTASAKADRVAEAVKKLSDDDKRLAAMLVKRDTSSLAKSLSPFTGDVFAHYVFGIGVVGMAVSSIIILMLINGYVLCEVFDAPSRGWLHRLGCMMPLVGIMGPFIWGLDGAQTYLAMPTSNIAFVLLPIAYFAFMFLMNQKGLLGDAMPKGPKRLLWNVLMFLAAGILGVGCVWKMWISIQWRGIGLIGAFVVLAVAVHLIRKRKTA